MRSSSKKPLNLRAQKLLLDQCFPEAACTIKGRTLIWEGKIRPSVVSCFYQIRIIYTLGEPPDVFVLSPDLQTVSDATKPGRRPPHIYGTNPLKLCLYLPGTSQWNSGNPLVTKIVPWTIMWLSFFEDWVFTDVWSGGGTHPNVKELEEPGSGAKA